MTIMRTTSTAGSAQACAAARQIPQRKASARFIGGTPGTQPIEQMVADPKCVGDDRQRRVDCRARRKKAGVDDVQIVELVRPAVYVECGGLRVVTEAYRAVLVAGAGDRQAFSK